LDTPCEHCGKPLQANMSVCPNCGSFNLSPERQRYLARKNRTWIIVLGSFVGCAVLVPVALFLGALAICSNLGNGGMH